MKKTVNVSLGGYAFQIEDDAYARLDRYLEGVKRRFASYPDATEIVDDIEARMGEKLMTQHGVGKILALPVIEALISEMGDAEEIDEDKEDGARPETTAKKRFFRDGDDAIIAGVCSGIAAYFGVDPMWIRLAFAISILFGGFGIVVYVILWIIVPQARTGLEKAQMHGQPFNLDEFEKNVKERIARIKAEDGPHLRRAGEGLAGFLREVGQRIGSMVRFLGKTFFKIIGAIISVGASIALAMVVFASITLLVNRESAYVDMGFALPLSSAMAVLMVASVAIVAAVPLFFLILIGSSLVSGRNKFTKMVGFNLLALWILGLVGTGNFAIKYAPQIREQVEQRSANQETREYAESGFSSVSISSSHHVRIVKAETFSVRAIGAAYDLERLEVAVKDGKLAIRDKEAWKICFFCWGERVEVEVTMPTLEGFEASGASNVSVRGFDGVPLRIKQSGAARGEIAGTFPSIDAEISGASRLVLSGKATELSAELSGASRLEAGEGEIGKANLDLSGASRVALGTVATLSVEASGASRVTYEGNPQIVKQRLSGASRVMKADEEDEFDERGFRFEDENDEIYLENPTPPATFAPLATPKAPRTSSGSTKK